MVKRSGKRFLQAVGEFGFIRMIHRSFPARDRSILLGIGDDAAVLKPRPGRLLLLTVDTLREGVHFSRFREDPFSIGWKAAAVSASDIAAMGGIPRWLLMSLALPETVEEAGVRGMLDGMKALLKQYSISLIGGNVSRSKEGVSIDTTLIGEGTPGALLTRGGARAGDLVYVTGTLGDSAAGLEVLERNRKTRGGEAPRPRRPAGLIRRHLRPEPRVEEGRWLSRSGIATAAIDVSDGLLRDLGHLCEESRVGARIDAKSLPLSPELKGSAPLLRRPLLEYAAGGGEDYELLFTVSPRNQKPLEALGRRRKFSWTRIGVIVRKEERIALVDESGRPLKMESPGFDHFRRSSK
jgi:thiamine-monophosphate kinase